MGNVVSGVIGKTKLSFDVWGDAVNVASRLESAGVPGVTQVSADIYELLKDDELFVARGVVEIKGRGKMQVYTTVPAPQRHDDPPVVSDPEAAQPSNAVHVFYNLLTAP